MIVNKNHRKICIWDISLKISKFYLKNPILKTYKNSQNNQIYFISNDYNILKANFLYDLSSSKALTLSRVLKTPTNLTMLGAGKVKEYSVREDPKWQWKRSTDEKAWPSRLQAGGIAYRRTDDAAGV